MKKIIIILSCVLVLVGCTNENDKTKEYDKKYEEMKTKLVEYGKLIFENDQWLNDKTKPGKYMMSLKDMNERNNYDISIFKNPATMEICNKETTQIIFVFNGLKNNKYDFTYDFHLDCN